ncbi:MAG: cryptochrome/photolyase family protein [Gemmatimonadota bacterium]
MSVRNLVLVLGDQLSHGLTALDGLDTGRDVVLMTEAPDEIERVPTHRLRTALFLSAMRHFRDALAERGVRVVYRELGPDPVADEPASFAASLGSAVTDLAPERVILTRPGAWRVLHGLRTAAGRLGIPLELREDTRFICDLDAFRDWADGRRRLVLEDFYRHMRREHGVLVEAHGGPVGGEWNYDEANRESFGRDGPPDLKPPRRFRQDAVTEEVLAMVAARWPDHPGSLDHFHFPVTHDQALAALRDFLHHRLDTFGRYQDAMWSDRPFLAHSRLSTALNLGLLDPLHCVREAERAYRERGARLASVEGFIRQILGWREFVRGVYWTRMPEYAGLNHLEADRELPSFFWDGDTDMECVRQAMAGVLDHGYAHHIQRLMVLGLFALQHGVDPGRFNDWHVAMYADAVDWVSLPNTLGMSQFADGGIVGTKPYCASGRYIDRMSDHCRHCRYDPGHAAGERACPFTTLYWDFLARHEDRFRGNRRMNFQLANLDRKRAELDEIRDAADRLRDRIDRGERV